MRRCIPISIVNHQLEVKDARINDDREQCGVPKKEREKNKKIFQDFAA